MTKKCQECKKNLSNLFHSARPLSEHIQHFYIQQLHLQDVPTKIKIDYLSIQSTDLSRSILIVQVNKCFKYLVNGALRQYYLFVHTVKDSNTLLQSLMGLLSVNVCLMYVKCMKSWVDLKCLPMRTHLHKGESEKNDMKVVKVTSRSA